MSVQKGILERPPVHATVLTFNLTDAEAASEAIPEAWADIVQLCSNDRAANHHVERSVRKQIEPAFRLTDYHYGFSMPESRGVLGFVDGTGNPKGEARVPVVLIGDEDPAYRDGTHLALRKIREDLDRRESLGVDQQERIVGRRKTDSAKLPGGAPANSHKEKSSVETEGGEVEILRRSFPFVSPDEAGLIFICFVRDLAQYETVKGQMVSPSTNGHQTGKDAIEEYYTAVAGGYYFVPPRPVERYPGEFLFE